MTFSFLFKWKPASFLIEGINIRTALVSQFPVFRIGCGYPILYLCIQVRSIFSRDFLSNLNLSLRIILILFHAFLIM